jgi:hypothetical protein
MTVLHFHWPYWAARVVDDVEHQGDLQMIGFVLSVSMTAAAFLLGILVLLFDALPHLR